MNWTSILNLFPLLVRLEPVIAKYGSSAIALYKADEPQALQLFSDIAAAIAGGNPVAFVTLAIKWGPILVSFVGTEAPVVQQFIADVKAALGTAPVASIAPSAGVAGLLAGLPIPINIPAVTIPSGGTGGLSNLQPLLEQLLANLQAGKVVLPAAPVAPAVAPKFTS
jgi:hypothetical protein